MEVFLDVVASAGPSQDFHHVRRQLLPVRRLRQADVIGAAHFKQVHITVSLPDDFECGGGVEDALQADPREDATVMKAFQCGKSLVAFDYQHPTLGITVRFGITEADGQFFGRNINWVTHDDLHCDFAFH